jgi:glucose-1-phosphate adenylyltransferase
VSDVYSMVLAGGVGSRLSLLTEQRAKPAVPFGGKYRIIDFVLSNLANSGYFDAALLTQYRPLSLIEHVATGRTWDLDRSLGGLQILQPYLEAETGEWYRGTADAVYRNLLQIAQRTSVADVLILSGDHVYAMDYRPLIRFHREHRFPATVAVTPLEDRDPRQFGVVETDANWQIAGFEEKPAQPRGKWASMGIYVFRRDILTRLLREDAADPDSEHDFGKNIFPRLIRVADVGAHVFEGYWQDIGTVDAFYEANMKLLDPAHIDAVARPSWPIRTPSVDAPPARVTSEGGVVRSLIANGAVVRGQVEDSIIFPGVVVEEGATVRGSIVMNGCGIEAGARVERTILDKRVRVGRGASIGGEGTAPPNRRVPDLLQNGLTLIGKSVIVEPEARVGRNVCLGGFARIPSGTPVEDGEYVDGSLPASLRLSAGAVR